ncbi:hypothetical protein EDF62_1613 [Leucobacter luti]|uniref:Uncharacterized protein n=1 Tax=Leucobacter luti TaxID=340320 RepID=A0A4R6S196_9MICO|nr:hypothetical protein [Leucobacter luti]TDP92406.1 hypothetical protein EDF62_1613 [Leucobacter luti]
MYAYSLTTLTGRKRNEGRMMVVATVEVNRHTLLVSTLSLIAGLVLAAPFALLSGYAFIVVPMITVPLGNLLFIGHQRRGLQVNRFNRIMNRMRGAQGFIINGTEFDEAGFVLHVPVVIDVPEFDQFEGFDDHWAPNTPKRIIARGKRDQSYEPQRVSAAHAFS